MNRRRFLQGLGGTALGLSLGSVPNSLLHAADREKGAAILKGMLIIDPHAQPDMDSYDRNPTPTSYRFMKEIGMAACCYSALGDGNAMGRNSYEYAMHELKYWFDTVVRKGYVKKILKSSDIPEPSSAVPGAIFGLEGGDALSGNVSRVDEFYRLGVRIITVVHYHNNEIGDIMAPLTGWAAGPYKGGLTVIGKAIIERMQKLGMVVDVAHSSADTLRDIVAMTQKPLIDSHTGLCGKELNCGRRRTWQEMEMVAGTGGVVCSWPDGWGGQRIRTFGDWANELLWMKKRLGIEHVGIGTDGGGLPNQLQGYKDWRDLVFLAEAMFDAGLSHDDIAAIMGQNVHRVMSECF